MTKISKYVALFSALPVAAVGTYLLAQQALVTQRFPQFENDDVKVWKSVIYPGAPMNPHRHEHKRVLIPIEGGTINLVQTDGKVETQQWETGKAYWFTKTPPNTMHSDVNPGTKPIVVMVVELKKD